MEQVSFIQSADIPKVKIGRPGITWATYFARMRKTGEAICLYPEDSRRAHVLRSTARSCAIQQGFRVSTSLVTEVNGELHLYIKMC